MNQKKVKFLCSMQEEFVVILICTYLKEWEGMSYRNTEGWHLIFWKRLQMDISDELCCAMG